MWTVRKSWFLGVREKWVPALDLTVWFYTSYWSLQKKWDTWIEWSFRSSLVLLFLWNTYILPVKVTESGVVRRLWPHLFHHLNCTGEVGLRLSCLCLIWFFNQGSDLPKFTAEEEYHLWPVTCDFNSEELTEMIAVNRLIRSLKKPEGKWDLRTSQDHSHPVTNLVPWGLHTPSMKAGCQVCSSVSLTEDITMVNTGSAAAVATTCLWNDSRLLLNPLSHKFLL